MQTRTSRNAGFTLLEIMIVVAIIGMLAGISTPNFIKARETSQLQAIINNLRVLESSKDQWAIEQKQGDGAQPLDTDLMPYLKTLAMPAPVVRETYNINPIGTLPTATIPANVRLGSIPPNGNVTLQ